MFTKVTAVLLIASVAFAAHVSFSENIGAKIDDDLFKLESTINATFKEARREIVGALNAFNRTAHEAGNGTTSALKRIGEGIQKDLDAIKAKAANVNISECLGQDEQTLHNLTIAFEFEDIRCLKEHERRVFEGLNNVTFHRINETTRLVSEIKGEIVKCDKKEDCLQKLDQRIERETRELPQRIEREAKEISKNIETVEAGELKKCGAETLRRAEAKGRSLLSKITTCVNGKLKN